MKILFFSNAYDPTISGVVTSIRLFRQGLLDAGHDVGLIAPAYQGHHEVDKGIYRMPAVDLTHWIDLSVPIPIPATIREFVYDFHPDIIHTHHSVMAGSLALAFAKEMDIPLCYTFHTSYEDYAEKIIGVAPRLVRRLTHQSVRRYLHECDHIIAPSQGIREFLTGHYHYNNPITVIPTPINKDLFSSPNCAWARKQLGLSNDAKILLYAGRLSREKNLPLLLEMLAPISAVHPAIYLVLIGKGPMEEQLQEEADELGLSNHVLFFGAVPNEQMPHFLAAADLFVFPSLVETQGLVILEALAAGTPVVAVDIPATNEVLSQGGGILVPPLAQPFSEAVISVLFDPKKSQKLKEQINHVIQHYDVHTASMKLVGVYQSALESAAGLSGISSPNRQR